MAILTGKLACHSSSVYSQKFDERLPCEFRLEDRSVTRTSVDTAVSQLVASMLAQGEDIAASADGERGGSFPEDQRPNSSSSGKMRLNGPRERRCRG